MENDVLYNRIMNVVHEEYGSGSAAVANPEGEATDDLEKIQIGDDIYSIGGSGGILLLTISESGGDTVLDKNYNEIKEAVESGVIPFALNTIIPGVTSINMALSYGLIEGTYFVIISPLDANQPNMTFAAASADGVLTLTQGG